MAKIIDTSTLTPDQGNLWIYNGLDCCLTSEIFDAIYPQLTPDTQSVYDFERRQLGPAMEMMLRGIRVDQVRRAEMVGVLERDQERLQSIINQMAQAVWDRDLNCASPKQMVDFFYGRMQLPPVIERGQNGEYRPSTSRAALEKLMSYFVAMPIINAILALRDIEKQLQMLRAGVDADGRIRCSYNVAGTETGRWSSSKNAFGGGCVSGEAEVLTPNGWIPIKDFQDGGLALQWDAETDTAEFVAAGFHKVHYEGPMLQYKTEQIHLVVTPDHRVPQFNTRRTVFSVRRAIDTAKLSMTALPLGCENYAGGFLAYPPLVVALMADGSLEKSNWRVSFAKDRKIERFIKLCKESGIEYHENSAKEGYRRFVVKNQNWPKKWGSWVFNLSPETAAQFVEEAAYWDSHRRGDSYIFFTADEEQAKWFQILCHIAGRATTLRLEQQNPGSWSTTPMWWVNVKPRQLAWVKREHWSKHSDHCGDVFCLRVPSTYFFVRYQGFVSITGNSNLQTITPRLRHVFIADPGMKLAYIDLEQAESRVVGLLAWLLTGQDNYLQACLNGDLHTTVCKMVWKNLGWTGDLSIDKKEIAEQKYYREYSYRDLAKRGGHGCLTAGHEVLTMHGWLDISLVPDGIPILAWNIETGAIEWEVPVGWTRSWYTGLLFNFEGPHFSLQTSDTHNMPFMLGGKRDYQQAWHIAGKSPTGSWLPSGKAFPYLNLTGEERWTASIYSTWAENAGCVVYCPTLPRNGGFIVRRAGKVMCSANSNYFGQPPTMAKHLKMPVDVVRDFQREYFRAFPEITLWHQNVAKRLRTEGSITTILGRYRQFFGRLDDDSTLREAIAYEPQSVIGDTLNKGLCQVWEAIRIHGTLPENCAVIAQIHDAILFQYPEDREQEIIPKVMQILAVPMQFEREGVVKDFCIPCDCKVGWNFGYQETDKKTGKVKNPNGMIGFKEGKPDTRKRVPEKTDFDELLSRRAAQ